MNQTKNTHHSFDPLHSTHVRKIPIMTAVFIAAFISILSETFLGNALPVLMKELQVTATSIQWLTTGYMLVIGVLVPVTAFLQSRFSTRTLFLTAMLIFLSGTLIAASAPSFAILLIGRLIQACSTGIMLPLTTNIILTLFPAEKRGTIMGLFGLVLMFGPAMGPTVSGIIVQSLSWRWLFIAVIPLSIISIVVGALYMMNVTKVTKDKVDLLSVILSTLAFGCIVYGFSTSGDLGWGNIQVSGTLAIGLASLALFIYRQLTIDKPILNLHTFRYKIFSQMFVLYLTVNLLFLATMTVIPMFLQGVLLLTAFQSGLVTLPGSVLNGLISPLSGRVFDKFGARAVIIPGAALVALAMILFTRVNASTSIGTMIIISCLLLLGIAMAAMPTQTHALNQLPKELYTHGAAIFNTIMQISAAVGTAVFISRLSSVQSDYLKHSANPQDSTEMISALAAGTHGAFTLGAIIAFVAFVISLFIKRKQKSKIKNLY